MDAKTPKEEIAEKPEVKKPVKEITIKLQTPVMAHGEMVSQLTFRRPTGGDLMSAGSVYPININWASGEVTPNPPAMGEMMVLLAAVPPPTIKALDSEDWATCAYALQRFFPPRAQEMQQS